MGQLIQLSIFDELAAREKEEQEAKERKAVKEQKPIDQTLSLGCYVKLKGDNFETYRVGAMGLGMVGLMIDGLSQVFNHPQKEIEKVVKSGPASMQHYKITKDGKVCLIGCEYYERTKHVWKDWGGTRILVTVSSL